MCAYVPLVTVHLQDIIPTYWSLPTPLPVAMDPLGAPEESTITFGFMNSISIVVDGFGSHVLTWVTTNLTSNSLFSLRRMSLCKSRGEVTN